MNNDDKFGVYSIKDQKTLDEMCNELFPEDVMESFSNLRNRKDQKRDGDDITN